MKKSSAEKRVMRLVAALLACMLLCACAFGCAKTSSGSDQPTATPEPSYTPAPIEPVRGGTLRLPMPINASRSDPLDVNTEEMLCLFSLVYDKLLTVNASGEIEPCLCESWTSEGTGVWTLRLRDGVKWHDNTRLTANDVVNTYNALVSMEDSYYKPCLKHIVSMQVTGTLTLKVVMNMTGLMGLYSLTFPIKKSAELVGTGAYRLESMDDDTVVLRVNDNWWNKTPYIERVIFAERDTNSTALASYEAGQLNMVPTDIITAGRYSEAGMTEVRDAMTQNMEVLLFNYSNPIFSDNSLRKAVAHGINRSRIITNVYSNKARAADVPIPPDSWLYDSRCAVLNYDTEAAVALIEEAGYDVVSKEGLRFSRAGGHLAVKLLTSATTENTIRSDAAQMIAAQLNELGFYVEIVTKAHTLGDGESDFVKALRSGDWDLALVGFSLGRSNELADYLETTGANNFGGIKDGELVQAARLMTVAKTEEELREAAYDFQMLFVEKVPFVTLYFRLNSVICAADIAGISMLRLPDLFMDQKNWYLSSLL